MTRGMQVEAHTSRSWVGSACLDQEWHYLPSGRTPPIDRTRHPLPPSLLQAVGSPATTVTIHTRRASNIELGQKLNFETVVIPTEGCRH